MQAGTLLCGHAALLRARLRRPVLERVLVAEDSPAAALSTCANTCVWSTATSPTRGANALRALLPVEPRAAFFRGIGHQGSPLRAPTSRGGPMCAIDCVYVCLSRKLPPFPAQGTARSATASYPRHTLVSAGGSDSNRIRHCRARSGASRIRVASPAPAPCSSTAWENPAAPVDRLSSLNALLPPGHPSAVTLNKPRRHDHRRALCRYVSAGDGTASAPPETPAPVIDAPLRLSFNRTASSDRARPRLLPLRSAIARATANTSSSIVTVVRIVHPPRPSILAAFPPNMASTSLSVNR